MPHSAGKNTTPGPWAVIFVSRRRANPADGYAEAAEELARLAETMPGYLGAQSVRDAAGDGVTVSYWDSAEAVATWRAHPAHAAARARADEWYESWSLTVCRVMRRALAREQGRESQADRLDGHAGTR